MGKLTPGPKAGRKWSRDEDRLLRKYFHKSKTDEEMSKLLDRSKEAIASRRAVLKLLRAQPLTPTSPYFATLKTKVRKLYAAGLPVRQIAAETGVSRNTIKTWISEQRGDNKPIKVPLPYGAQIQRHGLFYKRGQHGRLFRWNGDEWVRSTHEPSEVGL